MMIVLIVDDGEVVVVLEAPQSGGGTH